MKILDHNLYQSKEIRYTKIYITGLNLYKVQKDEIRLWWWK